MKYTGEFHSIDSRLWRIEIETPGTGADRPLRLSGTPFTASVSGSDKLLYTPIRCGGATVGILTDSFMPELYSGQAKGVKVTFSELTGATARVEWVGYVTPSMYDQGFDMELEEVQLDCVDGVAVLKNIPFRKEEKTQMTFLELIHHCLRESGCYTAFNISGNVQLSAGGTESVIEKFRVSSSNFFSERKDVTQTDDDVAWSCYDVLYQVLQFLGYTLIADGDEVFIIDYDAIATGDNTYFRYSLGTATAGGASRRTAEYSRHIDGDSYSSGGTQLSLDKIYNKVSVKDEFYTFDSLFPTFGDINFENNITAPGANMSSLFHNSTINDNGMLFGDHLSPDPTVGVNENTVLVIDSDWFGNWWINVFKFYDSPVFNFHKYFRNAIRQNADTYVAQSGGQLRYSDLLNAYNGAFYCRHAKLQLGTDISIEDINKWVTEQKRSYDFNAPTATKIKLWEKAFKEAHDLSKINLNPLIVFINGSEFRFGPGDEKSYNETTKNDVTKNYPYMTLKAADSTAVFGGLNHFIRIKGNIRYHDRIETPHPLSGGANNKSLNYHGDKKDGDQFYIWCKVKWGNRWWNGEKWQPDDCWFELYFSDPKKYGYGTDGWTNAEHYDKDFPIFSNRPSFLYLGEDGYVIPCPEDGNLEGQAELSFTTRDMHGASKSNNWRPGGSKLDNRYCRYLSNCVFISNLEVTAEVTDGAFSDYETDSDTIYTNVIENGSVDKMGEITFKVCTDDGKKPSYSAVDMLVAGQSQYIGSLYNKALASAEKGTSGCDGKDACLRQEEHYVFKLASQYENPRLVFKCNLHNDNHKLYGLYTDKTLSGRVFVATETETDYKFGRTNLTLTEKFKK